MINKREFLKNTMVLVGGVLIAPSADLLKDGDKQYKVKAVKKRSLLYSSIEFTYSGDKANIGDIITYQDKTFGEEPQNTPLEKILHKYSPNRFSHTFEITEITEV